MTPIHLREGSVSSNVGQNYPYTSESGAERAQAVAKIIEAHPELADKIAAETTPLEPSDGRDRWWVFKVPDWLVAVRVSSMTRLATRSI